MCSSVPEDSGECGQVIGYVSMSSTRYVWSEDLKGPHLGQGEEGARQTEAQMVHDKRSMTRRATLLGHWACSERN